MFACKWALQGWVWADYQQISDLFGLNQAFDYGILGLFIPLFVLKQKVEQKIQGQTNAPPFVRPTHPWQVWRWSFYISIGDE